MKTNTREQKMDTSSSQSCQGQMRLRLYKDPVSGCVSQRKIRELTCSTGECKQATQSSALTHRSVDNHRFAVGANHIFLGTNLKSNSKSYRSAMGSCCRPDRYRVRKLRLICADGSTRISQIKLARRCACTTSCDINDL